MSNDKHQDEQVSAAYQSMARERTPEHLDDKVLRMAKANAERPQYSRWIAWSRPLAWAATVALCLAITLEVTQVTTPVDLATETVPAEVAAPTALMLPELQKDKQEPAPERDMDQQQALADAISSEKHSAARGAAKMSANEPAPADRMRQSADLAEAESVEEMVVAPSMEIELKESNELRREYGSSSAEFASSKAIAADMAVNKCSEESRLQAESWLECIIALEADGDSEAATRQRENLIEVFPDFKLP
jgi:hypothetical protein